MMKRICLMMVLAAFVILPSCATHAAKLPKKAAPPPPPPIVVPVPAPVMMPPPPPPPPPPIAKGRSGLAVEAGSAGGAGVVRLDYIRPVNPGWDVMVNAGYGVGNQYNVMVGQLGMLWKSNPAFYAGLFIDYANYSEMVADIPGLPSVIDKGGRTGGGFVVGKDLGRIDVNLGYGTASGLNVFARYWF